MSVLLQRAHDLNRGAYYADAAIDESITHQFEAIMINANIIYSIRNFDMSRYRDYQQVEILSRLSRFGVNGGVIMGPIWHLYHAEAVTSYVMSAVRQRMLELGV